MNKVVAALCLFISIAFADGSGYACDNGIELKNNIIVMGDTSTAVNASDVACHSYKLQSPGVWFDYFGRGNAVILDTCDQRTAMDAIIFVFDSCDNDGGYIDSCVAVGDSGCNFRQSRVQFTAESNHHYHIFVTSLLNSTGIFYLSVSEVLPPDNYQCFSAVKVDRFPFSIEGDISASPPVYDACQGNKSSGLWYKVHGTGAPFVAHTCNDNTNYDTFISLFSECSMKGADDCIAYNDDSCYLSSMVNWRSVQNAVYYLFVTGSNNARGHFTLAIEERSMNPYSHCYEPIVISTLPFFFTAQTDYLETTFSECRNEDLQHSMFFRLPGVNRKIIATTCTSSSTVNDTVIDVYSGCEPMYSSQHPGSGRTCVASNDDYCGLGSAVVFPTTSDSYYISVSSPSPTIEGVSFSLSVLPYEDVENSQCWFAKDVDGFPDILTGSTVDMDFSEQTCDGSRARRRGGWFRYTHYGNETTLTLSTCNAFNTLAAKIEIYRDCNEMGCVAQAVPKHGCTELSFMVKNALTYNFFVTAFDPTSPGGYYHVDFYEDSPNAHNICESSYIVDADALPFRLEADTILASESFSECENKSKRGVWVLVTGTGNKLVASTCDSHTGFDTILELYNHCPDGNPHPEYCLLYSDKGPSCHSAEIEWDTDSGAKYWLFVTGLSDQSGVFVLNIYEKASPINAQCGNAIEIHNLPYYDYGVITYSKMSNVSCGNHFAKGNWYRIEGDDHWIIVSTCKTETNFATEIEVYEKCLANSGDTCVAHSHDFRCSPKTDLTFAGFKGKVFYIFVSGVDGAVLSEGFFGIEVSNGDKLPVSSSSIPSGSQQSSSSSLSSSSIPSGSQQSSSHGEPSSSGIPMSPSDDSGDRSVIIISVSVVGTFIVVVAIVSALIVSYNKNKCCFKPSSFVDIQDPLIKNVGEQD